MRRWFASQEHPDGWVPWVPNCRKCPTLCVLSTTAGGITAGGNLYHAHPAGWCYAGRISGFPTPGPLPWRNGLPTLSDPTNLSHRYAKCSARRSSRSGERPASTGDRNEHIATPAAASARTATATKHTTTRTLLAYHIIAGPDVALVDLRPGVAYCGPCGTW